MIAARVCQIHKYYICSVEIEFYETYKKKKKKKKNT